MKTLLNFRVSLVLGFAIVLFLGVSNAWAGEASLTWTAPTTNADGSDLDDLGGYHIYHKEGSGSYSRMATTSQTSYTAMNLTAGVRHCFYVTAYDTPAGNESTPSDGPSAIPASGEKCKDIPATCGNGVVDQGEQCDNSDMDGNSCNDFGFNAGTLACNNDCTFNTSSCRNDPVCGNGALESGEECDGSDLGSQTCSNFGFNAGSLACANNCSFDTSSCRNDPVCGNDIIEDNEQCEGSDLNGFTCQMLNFDGGTLSCAGCMLDTGSCINNDPDPVCGNNIRETGEPCDGSDLGGITCASFGFNAGSLACNSCSFDTSGCRNDSVCGNGIAELGESCDEDDLRNASCIDLDFDGGSLSCSSCTYNTSSCRMDSVCGNGQIESGETCEPDNLLGKTCVGEGYDGGTLGCTSDTCQLDTTGCTKDIPDTCGSGAIEGNEECDGTEFNGQSCAKSGFLEGELLCSSNCTIDTSNCFGEVSESSDSSMTGVQVSSGGCGRVQHGYWMLGFVIFLLGINRRRYRNYIV